MVRTGVITVVLACSFAWTGCTTEHAVNHRRDVVRGNYDSVAAVVKHDIVEMKNAGIGDDVVINWLRVSDAYFPMSTRDVVELADSGVSDSVINAMILGFRAESRDRTRSEFSYHSPYYWSNPYWYEWYPWYSWNPYYYSGFGFGYYYPFSGYRAYVNSSHFIRQGWSSRFPGPGHGATGGRRRR